MLNKDVSVFPPALTHALPTLIYYKGEPIHDPFRRSLTNAIQWHDNLRGRIEHCVDKAIGDADQSVQQYESDQLKHDGPATNINSARREAAVDEQTIPQVTNDATRPSNSQCARLLQQRCPACFGGSSFGRSFDE